MLSLFALATAALASCAAATPLVRRDACSGLGNGTTSNTGPFALYAYNENIATNTTGIPLVLASSTPSSGPTFGKLATWTSSHQGPLTQWDLTSNTLTPTNAPSGQAVDLSVSAGSELEWQFVSGVETPAAAQIYCIVDHSSPSSFGDNVLLAVNGETGLFSLCHDSTGLETIVYDADNSNGAYDYSTCTNLDVHVYYSVQPVA